MYALMLRLKALLRKHHVKFKESYVSMVVVMMDLDQEPLNSRFCCFILFPLILVECMTL